MATAATATGLLLATPADAQPAGTVEPPTTAATPALPPSSMARTVYEQQKDKLLQVRVLVAGSESQASAGSAFVVRADGVLVTNYHVVSQLVLEPDRYRAEYVRTDGQKGPLMLLAIDVQHDLALVKVVGANSPASPSPVAPAASPAVPVAMSWPTVTLAPDDSLRQGDKVFSLGNPLDMGFAIAEGTFNGFPERSLYPHLLFTGAMNPGVSGGPALDAGGRVVGVNVAGYGRNAELTNFQVPVRHVRELLQRAAPRLAAGKPASHAELKSDMQQQLMAHQQLMLDGLGNGAWPTQALGPYRVPVIPAHLARCWGDVSNAEVKNYRLESSRCSLDAHRYISPSLQVGSITTQHEVVTAQQLGPWRFAQLRSRSMANEALRVAGQNRERTATRCQESFVQQQPMSLRVVICARAYRKLEGLYDISTTVVTLDADQHGLESVLHLQGVDHARGLRESQRFVQAITRAAR